MSQNFLRLSNADREHSDYDDDDDDDDRKQIIRIIHVKLEPNHAINAWENTENVDRASPVTFDLYRHLNIQILGNRH